MHKPKNWLPPEEYIKKVTRPFLLSGSLLIRDQDDRILIVKPTYKDMWEVPGGVSEGDESPRETAEREVMEEIGLDIKAGKLLCAHYKFITAGFPIASFQMIFDGGVLSRDEIDQIKLQNDELSNFQFITSIEIPKFLNDVLNERLSWAYQVYLGNQHDAYLEERKH